MFWDYLTFSILTSSPGSFIPIDYFCIQNKLYVTLHIFRHAVAPFERWSSFQWSVFNLSPETFKCKSSGLKTLILLLPWYTKQRGYIVCIPITNYDRGFTQKRAGLLGPKQAERSFFYQVTIECGAILPACSCLRLCSPLCLVTFSQCHV